MKKYRLNLQWSIVKLRSYNQMLKRVLSNICLLCFALCSALGISILYDTPLSSTFFALLCLGCLMLYRFAYQHNFFLKNPFPVFTAFLLAIFLVIGKNLFNYASGKPPSFLLVKPINTVVSITGIGILFWVLFGFLASFTRSYGITESKSPVNPFISTHNSKKVFLVFFGLLVLCYLPYYLAFFPGILSPDSIGCWNMATGRDSLHNGSLILYIILMRLCFSIVGIFGGGITSAVALFSALQMISVAAVFAIVLRFLYYLGIPKWALLLAILYYSINPLHGYYSITHWRNIPLALTMTLLALQLIYWVQSGRENKLPIYHFIAMAFTLLGVAFFLSSGIYILFVIIPVLVAFRKVQRKILSAILFSVLVFTLLIYGPVFNLFNIKTRLAESLAIPLQQVGRIVATESPITIEQRDAIARVIPLNVLKQKYNFITVDSIKFDENFNGEVIEANKYKYLVLLFIPVKPDTYSGF